MNAERVGSQGLCNSNPNNCNDQTLFETSVIPVKIFNLSLISSFFFNYQLQWQTIKLDRVTHASWWLWLYDWDESRRDVLMCCESDQSKGDKCYIKIKTRLSWHWDITKEQQTRKFIYPIHFQLVYIQWRRYQKILATFILYVHNRK